MTDHINDAAINEIESLVEENTRLKQKLVLEQSYTAYIKSNRDHFCHYVNEIARLFWGDDKQCYAPDAVLRKVQNLRKALIEISKFGTKQNPCWCGTRTDWDHTRADTDHDEQCVNANKALGFAGD